MKVPAKILLIALLWIFCLPGCGNRRHTPTENEGAADLQQIKDSGELVVLTLYSSISYFNYRGQEMGFQYELSEQFAQSLGVKLRVVVAKNVQGLINKLLAGEGDIIAYNVPITKELKERLIYCGEEVITQVSWLL